MSLVTNIDNIFKKGVIGNVRTAQEDSHDIALKTPNGDVFVVCDGMGGHVGGAKASGLAVECIIKSLERERYDDPIQALNDALQFANMQILGFANDYPEYRGMGTTACIVLMRDNDVWIAHVGDSRIYLYLGKEKELHRITKDHSFVQTLVDAGEITDDEAEHHPNKNRILKALGIRPDMQPSFNHLNQPIHPKNGDIFLICSDGLSGMIPDTTIEKVLAQDDVTIDKKGEMLIQLAMQGETVQPGGQDNCTVELICVDNSPWQNSEFQGFNPAGRPRHEFVQNNNINVAPSPTSGASAASSTSASPSPKTSDTKPNTGKHINKQIIVIACIAVALIVGGVLLWNNIGGGNSQETSEYKGEDQSGAFQEAEQQPEESQDVISGNVGQEKPSDGGSTQVEQGFDLHVLYNENRIQQNTKVKKGDYFLAMAKKKGCSDCTFTFNGAEAKPEVIDAGGGYVSRGFRVNIDEGDVTITYGNKDNYESYSLKVEKTTESKSHPQQAASGADELEK